MSNKDSATTGVEDSRYQSAVPGRPMRAGLGKDSILVGNVVDPPTVPGVAVILSGCIS